MPHMSNLPWIYMYAFIFIMSIMIFLVNSKQNHPLFSSIMTKMITMSTTWKW